MASWLSSVFEGPPSPHVINLKEALGFSNPPDPSLTTQTALRRGFNNCIASKYTLAGPASALLIQWSRTVQDYSNRDLSHSEDKLTAISGVARLFLDVIKASEGGGQEIYHAGLWSSEFVSGLLWRVESDDAKRPAMYRAPTWSWASIDGPVNGVQIGPSILGGPPFRHTHVAVNKVACELENEADPTGRVKGGYADLTGPLVPVELVTVEADSSAPTVRKGVEVNQGHPLVTLCFLPLPRHLK
jgi:hypothetical protein